MTLKRKILIGDVLEQFKNIPDGSVDTIVSSPPYWGLRDYGEEGQWGLEKDFHDYLDKLDAVMNECWRVLKPTGSCWINLGDTYSGGMKELQTKSRVGIPERFYIRCIDNGWIARNHIVWTKANSMPSSVRDRFTNKWESVFFFVKQKKYYFNLDAVRETPKTGFDKKPFNRRIRDAKRLKQQGLDGVIVGARMSDKEESTTDKNGNHQPEGRSHFDVGKSFHDRAKLEGVSENNPSGKNPGDVFKEFQGQVNFKQRYSVFNDLQEQGKRFKVSEIETTTIGEPLEDRKYAKVDTAKILGQGQTIIHQRMQEARDTGSAHDTGLNNPSGKNPGDIFEINTRPFVKAHFATFPPALPEKILKASCPKQVCKKCKKPRQPISESKQVDIVNCNARGKLRPKSGEDIHLTESMGFSKKYNTINTIIGYTDCGCKAGFEAGTVLDPFFGAGTVGIVAEELSLNWIGIELKKEYADIATERLKPYTTQYKLGEIE